MDLMTDFELHRFVQPYKYLNKYALKNEEWMDAGKVKKLMQMIPEIKARGDRILIFSQFVSVLEILGLVLETMGMKFLTLTGQTNVNDRQGLVDEFTEDDTITCFLLSTRAGGLGLNLMAANVVIIMDMDFNPHNDKQAQGESHICHVFLLC
jgi:SWI/SNF-related matrix-associated actin-dependent regulator 1 of chromatin subfamily A